MIKKLLIRLKAKKEEKVLKENRRKEKKEQLKKDSSYIVSENANPDNILIDTCALSCKRGTKVIDSSERVNVLYTVIAEMDKKKADIKRKKRKSWQEEGILFSNILKYSKEMLENSKYILIQYGCNDQKEYTDDIILKYLKGIPKRKRPTLLTADKLLAVKAKCLNLDFILINPEDEEKNTNTAKNNKQKNKDINQKSIEEKELKEKKNKKALNVLGQSISCIKNRVKIKSFCKDSIIFLVNEDKCNELNTNIENIIDKSFEYLAVVKYMRKYKMVRIVKITIKKGIETEVYDCKFVNEIYKLPIHENVLETAKNQFESLTP